MAAFNGFDIPVKGQSVKKINFDEPSAVSADEVLVPDRIFDEFGMNFKDDDDDFYSFGFEEKPRKKRKKKSKKKKKAQKQTQQNTVSQYALQNAYILGHLTAIENIIGSAFQTDKSGSLRKLTEQTLLLSDADRSNR